MTKPITEDGKDWKFCTKCKCKKTGRHGIYQLSHFDAEHIDNFGKQNEGNLASVDDPHPFTLGIPAITTSKPSGLFDGGDIEFVGAWYTPVELPVVSSAERYFRSPTMKDAAADASEDTSTTSCPPGRWCTAVELPSNVTLCQLLSKERIFLMVVSNATKQILLYLCPLQAWSLRRRFHEFLHLG